MKKIVVRGIMAFLAFVFLYPLVYVLCNSFMSNVELSENLRVLLYNTEGFVKGEVFPHYPTLRWYVQLLFDTPEFFVAFWNSVKMSVGVILGQLLIAVPAAWGLAKYRFRGKGIVVGIYMILMMIPFQVRMFPEYMVLNQFQLLDTYWAIILPGVFSTFAVIIVYYFFRQIPDEMLEVARLDGAGEWQIFRKIGMPMGLPGIISMITLSFIEYWNLIEQPMVFLKDKIRWPFSLLLPNISYSQAGVILVTSVITCIPSLLVFLYGETYLEESVYQIGDDSHLFR